MRPRLSRLAPATAPAVQAASSASSAIAATASAVVDSVALFSMGYEAEAVGKALVAARGNAAAALEMLKESPPQANTETNDPTAAGHQDEDDELARAIAMSLEAAPATKKVKKPDSNHGGPNAFWAPPRYLPAGGSSSLVETGPRTLSLVEPVQVRDGGYGWQSATAFLDTGNQALTLVDTRFAARHMIFKPDQAANLLGQHGSGLGQAERWTTIRGVVPGASHRAPVVTIALKVRNEEMLIQAAVSDMSGQGHDLLIGADVLAKLFAAGFRIGQGSM